MPHAALWVVQPRMEREGLDAGEWFQCRTRLCGWCNSGQNSNVQQPSQSFNAARGFVGGATRLLWRTVESSGSFNAARGFVGGATSEILEEEEIEYSFQCRTRLCGWCNCIARSPCPPRGKKPFWKVSENLSVLTENM